MASQERIPDKSQEKLLLIATIEDLLRHEIALREDGELVFPAQFTREHPELPEPRGGSILFEFEGSPQSVYTTLAVRLAHSGMFKEKQMWRNAVSYSVADKTCSMLLKELDEGRGQLRVFFSEGADDVTRQQFEGFVFAHLHRRAVPESVVQRRVLGCPKCKEVITDRQSSARRALGKDTILCPVCETEFSIVAIEEHLERLDPSIIDEFDNAADYGRDYSAAQTTLEGKHSTGDFDVFLCHNTYDKPAVKHAGECLKAIGLLPWLDEWELQPGKPWQRGVENQILKAKSAAVFVSTSGMGPWQDLEQEALLREFVKRQCPVIPVLLPGYKNERSTGQPLELPIFLSGMTWVDMRKPKPNPFERLVWGITGSHPLNLDSPTRSLVNRLSPERLVQRLSELAPTEFDPERLRERVTESVPFTEPRQMRITRKRLPQPEKRKSHQSQRK